MNMYGLMIPRIAAPFVVPEDVAAGSDYITASQPSPRAAGFTRHRFEPISLLPLTSDPDGPLLRIFRETDESPPLPSSEGRCTHIMRPTSSGKHLYCAICRNHIVEADGRP